MASIDIQSNQTFYDLDLLINDREVLKDIQECFQIQKAAGEAYERTIFCPNPQAVQIVNAETLEKILATNEDISDIHTHDISNCLVFHADNLKGSVMNDEVLRIRRSTDEAISKCIKEIFLTSDQLRIECGGQFWYPSGGYVGWHTNSRLPGWWLYVSYAEEPHRSYFRYRDCDTKEIVTSADDDWNFRLYKVTPDRPFWHCVYSETNRFSLGYRITFA